MPTKGGVILPNEAAVVGKPEVAGFFRSGSTVRHSAAMVPVDPDTHEPIQVGGRPIGFDLRESVAYPAINEYWPRLMWKVPVGKRFYPMRCDFGGVTAGGNCEIVIATRWATYDMGANVFTDTGGDFTAITNAAETTAVANANRFHQRISGRVRTTLSAVATSLQTTTLSARGGVGGTLHAYAASHAAGRTVTVFPNVQYMGQYTSGQDPAALAAYEVGFIGISAVAESPSTAGTGIVDFYGETVIGEGRHAATDSRMIEISVPGSVWVDANDYIIVYGAQPAVTAYQREFSFSGILTDVPA